LVDFDKLLGKTEIVKDIDPIAIFANLDKESGKEYLRPPQESVLRAWHEKLRSQRDTIIKLHTGQGKTLIGLSILQSYINEGLGPVLYICPNNYLVNQTVEQARSFGFKIVQFSADSKHPREFLNSEAILITNCNKLFNGKSVFGVYGSGKEPIQLGAIVIDDAHKCLQIIRDAFSFVIRRDDKDGKPNSLYGELWNLFEESIRRQREGTCLDIAHGKDCLMAVPFWTWNDKRKEVLKILEKHKKEEELLYVWDLLKDRLDQTTCVFSGNRIEIAPRLLPLELIPSFAQAQRRIFLSATLAEDAFLVRDLGISSDSVLSQCG
jgi:Rad3-related DNA helicase